MPASRLILGQRFFGDRLSKFGLHIHALVPLLELRTEIVLHRFLSSKPKQVLLLFGTMH